MKSITLILCLVLIFLTLTSAGQEGQQIQFEEMSGIEYSPDGRLLAVASTPYDCLAPDSITNAKKLPYAIEIFDTQTGAFVSRLVGHACFIRSIAWDSSSTRLVSAGDDGSTQLWDIRTGLGEFIDSIGYHTINGDVNWSRDNQFISNFGGSSLVIWDIETEEETHFTLEKWARIVTARWSPNGTRIATLDDADTLTLWDASQLADGVMPIISAYPNISELGIMLSWHPDSRMILVGGADLRLVDTETGIIEKTFPNPYGLILDIEWNPIYPQFAAAATLYGKAVVWNIETSAVLIVLDPPAFNMLRTVAWSPDGLTLAYGGSAATLGDEPSVAIYDFSSWLNQP